VHYLIKNFKATEFRLFLLYTGPAVLKIFYLQKYYEHFLLFHTGIYIFKLKFAKSVEWISLAQNILNAFIELIPELYGEKCLIYNMHSLSHLSNECLNLVTLDKFSASPLKIIFKL